MRSLIILTLICSLSPVAQADIYKRVDKDGVVHFTNRKAKKRGWKRVVKSSGSKRRKTQRTTQTPAVPYGSSYRDKSPQRFIRYNTYIEQAAHLYQLPVPFLRAVMFIESNYQPHVISRTGATGLMQLMPGTAKRMGVQNPFDVRENIFGGARYLRVLANQFNGDLVLTIAAYNAGEHAVMRYKGIPPYAETQRYVRRVLKRYYLEKDKYAAKRAS